MIKRIALIGCGNIGSRHLQALARLPLNIEVDIVEPNKNAQKLAKLRLSEINYNKKLHKFFWHETIAELKSSNDLAIVATTSVGRVKLINKLLQIGFSRFLIEKIVCQSQEEYRLLLTNMKKFNAKGWINTNLRYFESYKVLKQYFKKTDMIHISLVTAGHYGLGTNAIHYLDLFSWFTNDYKITLDGRSLTAQLFPNKRNKNLIEFAGTISGSTSNGSTITLTFMPNVELPLIVNIYSHNRHIGIDETNEKIFSFTEKKCKLSYVYEHVSSLTTKIVKDILKNDSCDLTTVENSYYLHSELFRILNNHIQNLTNKKSKICPIT